MILNKQFPGFKCESYEKGQISEFDSDERLGKSWTMLFFYPMAFTLACSNELQELQRNKENFDRKKCEIYSVSVDSAFVTRKWATLDRKDDGLGVEITFPMLADSDRSVSKAFDVMDNNGRYSVRATIFIAPDGVVKHYALNDKSTERNIEECLRVLDALQRAAEHGQVCPMNLKKADSAVKS